MKLKCLKYLFLFSFCIISCVNIKNTESTPDWFLHTPESTVKYEYFTASGVGANPNEAETIALSNIITEVSRYLGISIKFSTTNTVYGNIDNLTKILENKLEEEAAINIENFKIIEKQFINKKESIIAYILARYDKQSLEIEKKRIQSVKDHQNMIVKKHSQNAENFSNTGNYFFSALEYIKLAEIINDTKIDNYKLLFEESINNAIININKITLNTIKTDQNISSFLVQSNQRNIPLRVEYYKKINDNIKYISKSMHTNDIGQLTVSIPTNLVKNQIYIYIDFNKLTTNIDEQTKNRILKESQKNTKITFKKKYIQSKIKRTFKINIKNDDIHITKSIYDNLYIEFSKQGLQIKEKNYSDIIDVYLHISNLEKDGDMHFIVCSIDLKWVDSKDDIIFANSTNKRSSGFSEESAYNNISDMVSKFIIDTILSTQK